MSNVECKFFSSLRIKHKYEKTCFENHNNYCWNFNFSNALCQLFILYKKPKLEIFRWKLYWRLVGKNDFKIEDRIIYAHKGKAKIIFCFMGRLTIENIETGERGTYIIKS